MFPTYLTDVFGEYRNEYIKILNNIYPAKNSTGFPERNLTVNFIRGYEAALPEEQENIFSWYEFQFGDKNNRHIDALLFNQKRGELFIIESKRYSNPDKKIKEVGTDIDRINELACELEDTKTNAGRIPMKKYPNIYGIILADAWAETETKINIIESYRNKTFCDSYLPDKSIKPCYDVKEFYFSKFYHLLSFVWKIR